MAFIHFELILVRVERRFLNYRSALSNPTPQRRVLCPAPKGFPGYQTSDFIHYQVKAPTPFLFNIEAQKFDGQTVLSERLTISPDLPTERWIMPESGNRYLRVLAHAGELKVRYEAKVSLEPVLEAPGPHHRDRTGRVADVSAVDLYPSRYRQATALNGWRNGRSDL